MSAVSRSTADDLVRYQGEPVALVAADHPEIARRAAQKIVVDYEVLTPVTDARGLLAMVGALVLPLNILSALLSFAFAWGIRSEPQEYRYVYTSTGQYISQRDANVMVNCATEVYSGWGPDSRWYT